MYIIESRAFPGQRWAFSTVSSEKGAPAEIRTYRVHRATLRNGQRQPLNPNDIPAWTASRFIVGPDDEPLMLALHAVHYTQRRGLLRTLMEQDDTAVAKVAADAGRWLGSLALAGVPLDVIRCFLTASVNTKGAAWWLPDLDDRDPLPTHVIDRAKPWNPARQRNGVPV